jgi:hypothetical protein
VYVSHKLQQIAVSVDQDGLEATSKQRPVSSVGSIETLGEHTIDVSHGPGKISEGSVDQQMVVIVHETIGMDFHSPPDTNILEKIEELEPIDVREEYLAMPGATMEDVVPGSRIFDP